jgi:capsular exopolysaccharide synthesis family protein
LFGAASRLSLLKTIMITSTLRGEGKSTTALNLSIALADLGKKTLLIDADLRRGCVHDHFALSPFPGVTDIVLGNSDAQQCISPVLIPNLFVLPKGKYNARPVEMLASEKFRDMLNLLKSKYDAIIIDTPPIINMPDANVLSKLVEGIVMVVQASRTRKSDIITAKTILDQVNAPILGFLLNNVEYYMPRYMYDYYYDEY